MPSPVDVADVSIPLKAVNATGRPPRPQDWVLIARDYVTAELKRIEEDPTRFSRETFFGLAEELAKTLDGMKRTVFLVGGSDRFITCDCPVVIKHRNNVRAFPGLLELDAEVYFPLSRTALLHMEHDRSCQLLPRKRQVGRQRRTMRSKSNDIFNVEATATMVEMVNDLIASRAHLWAFSGREAVWLQKKMSDSSRVPKRTKAILESVSEDRKVSGTVVFTKIEFVVQTHE